MFFLRSFYIEKILISLNLFITNFRFTHLQHNPFTYTILINNDGGAQRFGMVRIFMAPRFDERGTEMLLRDQRHLFIEMDKFVVARKYKKILNYKGIQYNNNTFLLSRFTTKIRSK